MEYNEVYGNKIKNMIICLTSNCSLKCKHCYENRPAKPKELSLDDIQWIHDTFDIKNVNLMGGEPFLYPHLEEAIMMFKKVTITTNGLFLASDSEKAKGFLELFKKKQEQKADGSVKKNLSVQLSIEAGPEETDSIRGPGVWKQVLKTAKLLKENDVECYFRCSYHSGNLKIIPELIDYISQPMGIPLVLFPRIDLEPLDIREQVWLFNRIIDKNKEFDGRNLIAQPHFMQFLGKEEGRCEAGSERLCINYNGDITPCHLDTEYILGQIGMKIETLDNTRRLFLSSSKKVQDACQFCKNADVCRSSCYVANSYFGCPKTQSYDINNFASERNIEVSTLTHQISRMGNLIKDSLIC